MGKGRRAKMQGGGAVQEPGGHKKSGVVSNVYVAMQKPIGELEVQHPKRSVMTLLTVHSNAFPSSGANHNLQIIAVCSFCQHFQTYSYRLTCPTVISQNITHEKKCKHCLIEFKVLYRQPLLTTADCVSELHVLITEHVHLMDNYANVTGTHAQ